MMKYCHEPIQRIWQRITRVLNNHQAGELMTTTKIGRLDQSHSVDLGKIVTSTNLMSKRSLDLLLGEIFASPLPDAQCLGYFDSELRGFVYFKKDMFASDVLIIFALAVNPTHQNRGIGTSLLNGVLFIARENLSSRMITIESSQNFRIAHKLYNKLGFSVSGRIQDYFSSGEDKIIFTLLL